MGRYVAARLLQSVPVFIIVSIVIFMFLRLAPGDPALMMIGMDATPTQIELVHAKWGLDEPLVIQYFVWLNHVFHGDLGKEYLSHRPIAELIVHRLPATMHLAVGSMLVMIVFGFPLGIFVAMRPRHLLSHLVAVGNAIAWATPTFWLGILLLLGVAVYLKWLPPSGFVSITENPVQCIKHLILPCLTLGASGIAVIIRYLNSSLTEIMGSDFIRTAHAKGLPERVVVIRHMLKIAMLPVITVIAIMSGRLVGGSVIVESIFWLPGLGRLMLDAICSQEYQVIQSVMLLYVFFFVVFNILADVSYAFLDPRIRY